MTLRSLSQPLHAQLFVFAAAILIGLFFYSTVVAQNSDGGSTPASAAPLAGRPLPPEKAEPLRLPLFAQPPIIDGKLDDEVWKHAAVFKDFYQWRPSDSARASLKTEAMAGYDSTHIYFAFHAYDDPGKVRATFAKRDAIFDDDTVGILLDTFNDRRRAYELIFNPLGVQADGILQDGGDDDFSVDIVMESKGTLTTDGYTIEVSIPFKSLRYEAGKGKLWGLHILRQIKHENGERDSWMPISQNQSGLLSQEGHITGLEGISTERTLSLIPSFTVSETGRRVRTVAQSVLDANPGLTDPGRLVNPPLAYDLGLTVEFSLTPTITLDLAVNPDFAQVEADQTVVTVNQRFPIFFEEKRPFFLEGIDYFRTPIQAVHTRTIINPAVAGKLTGKRGRNTFGILLAADRAPGNFSDEERNDPSIFPDIERFIDKKAYIGVLRAKRDIGQENSLGILATSYNFIENHNQLGGFDGRFRLDKQTVVEFQVLGTTSRQFFFDPDQGKDVFRTGNGFAYTFNYSKQTRHWSTNFEQTGRTRDYRAAAGFTSRTNTNNFNLFVRHKSEPKPKAKLVKWRISNFIGGNFDFQKRMQNWGNNTQLQLNFQHETFWGIGYERSYERVFEGEFGPRRTLSQAGTFAGNDNERSSQQRDIYSYFTSTPSKKYNYFVLGVYNWGVFDLDFGGGPKYPRVSPGALFAANAQASGLCITSPAPSICNAAQDPGPGNQLHFEGNLTYQPTDAWRNNLSLSKDRLVRRDTGRVAFDDNILSWRSTYQFTRFMFLRARVDYETIDSRIRGQFLFGWTPNPGTAFYAGYNDDITRNGFSPFTGQLEPGLRRNGRTFFIKVSYLFRKSFGG